MDSIQNPNINEFIDSSLDNISLQVKRRLETSRSKRAKPLILSKDHYVPEHTKQEVNWRPGTQGEASREVRFVEDQP